MSRGRRFAIRGGLAAAGLAALLVLALLVAAIFWPIPLTLLQPLVEARLSRAVAPFSLSAEGMALRWGPGATSLTLIAQEITIRDDGGREVGALPRAEADLPLGDLLRGGPSIAALRLREPKVALIREDGAGWSLALSPFGPAAEQVLFAGPAFESQAEALWSCSRQDLPAIALSDASFYLVDQAAAVNLQFAGLGLTFLPAAQGGRLNLSSHLAVAGQRLAFDLTAEQLCADRSLTLSLIPKAVNPAILGEVVPNGGLLYPFEVPVSGRLDLSFSADRSLESLDFDLNGGEGSLEIASYAARNLVIEGLSLDGSYRVARRYLDLREGRLDLKEGRVLLGGEVTDAGEEARFSLHLVFLGESLANLLPRWFAGLQTALRKATAQPEGLRDVGLTLEGRLDRNGDIDARGRFFHPALPQGGSAPPDAAYALDFRLTGRLTEPALVISGQTP